MSNSKFISLCRKTALSSRLPQTAGYLQHGSTSCLMHCIAVAYYSYQLSKKLRILKLNEKDLIRGALLHDYFLYDWHIKDSSRPLHGTNHPEIACRNAEQDFRLSDIERDIIRKHMFPCTIIPPRYLESAIVCIVDKFCSINESFRKKPYKNQNIKETFSSITKRRLRA